MNIRYNISAMKKNKARDQTRGQFAPPHPGDIQKLLEIFLIATLRKLYLNEDLLEVGSKSRGYLEKRLQVEEIANAKSVM